MPKVKRVLEAGIKERIKLILIRLECWYFMPVQNGYGAASLDFLCAKNGRMFAIEAKAPGKLPTKRQILTMTEMDAHNIPSFVCDGSNMELLEEWIVFLK